MIRLFAGALLGAVLLCRSPALAGPPFVTDDPEPAEYGHVEINSAWMGTSHLHGQDGLLPQIDINYGAAPDLQLHVQPQMAFHRESGHLHYGLGDTELGVKYRFIAEDEDGWRPQVAVYPLLELPTGSVHDGLGAGYGRALLPLWAQKTVGDWTSYGGGGLWLNRHEDNRDYWFIGWVVLYKVSDSFSLGPELFRQTADSRDGKASSAFNIGGSYALADDNNFIFSFGRGLENADVGNRFSFYVGWQTIL
jgi:hypothetical protein